MQIQTSSPNLQTLLQTFSFRLLADFYCHRVGIIQSFDTSTLTASVKLVDKGKAKGMMEKQDGSLEENVKLYDLPLLTDCPVVIVGGGGGFLNSPIKAGDACLVAFNDRDIDNWFVNGGVNVPNTIRMHDISDGIVLVGLYSQTNALKNYIDNAFGLQYKNAKVMIDNAGKVDISNSSNTLKVILQDLVNAIKSIKCLNPNTGSYDLPIEPETIAALTAITTQLNLLLK